MSQVTMQVIAEKIGISRQTVSRVLNNKKDPVKEETRAKIMKVARELNFRPNMMAQALRTGKTNLIGVTTMGENTGQFNWPYPGLVYKGIMDTCREYNYGMTFHDFPEITGPRQYRGLVESGRVDGLIFLLFSHNHHLFTNEDMQQLAAFNIPYVAIHSLRQTDGFPFVGLDTFAAGGLAVRHFIAHGYERIACVKTTREFLHGKDLTDGYGKAIRDAGLEEIYFASSYVGIKQGYELANRLIEERVELPDAFFAIDTHIAAGMIKRFQEAGIRTPEDVAFIGFGDTSPAVIAIYDLTTIRQPAQEKGEKAVRLLWDMIHHSGENAFNGSFTFEPELRISRSCGCGRA